LNEAVLSDGRAPHKKGPDMNGKHWIIGIWAMVTWMAFTPASVVGQDSHAHHGTASAAAERGFQAKISAPVEISPGQSFSAIISIQDDKGQAVNDFDIFQEKRMHLILVRDDLAFFSHLHPEYQGKGKFRMEASLPSPGNYTLFCDYPPAGAREQISVLKLRVNENTASG
jgi:hypothetical protein